MNLAIAMAAGPGQYALLLGSGVSRSAGVPTGWEVTLDLVSRIARVRDGEAPADPEAWWAEHRSGPPHYSKLLEELAQLPTERSQLLQAYFEPTAEERDAGTKIPAPAHRAIARLVATDVVRVIITTNFDRLLEQAIQDEGIAPVILSTSDQASGASPLVHNRCTILKVNGDYRDFRIKNTEEELASYDPQIEMLLDRILDEYGLVVCGWSAEWDAGLRAALGRAKNRRYTTYWAGRGVPGAAATDLIALRQAVHIPIRDADQFFEYLADRVAAVQASGDDPESVAVALAQLKRYLARRRDRIRYADLMRGATEDLVRDTSDDQFPPSVDRFTLRDAADRARRYTQLANRVTHLVAGAAYWGEEAHVQEITTLLRRLAEAPRSGSRQTLLLGLVRYPALLGMYAAGVAMVARQEYTGLSAILSLDVRTDHERRPLLVALSPNRVLAPDIAKELRGAGRHSRITASDELHEALRIPFSDLIPSDDEYADAFDRFECLLALAEADWWIASERTPNFSLGRFSRHLGLVSPGPLSLVADELERDGTAWPPLSAGMFGGDIARLRAAKAAVDDWAAKFAW
ncbi:MAG: hypothetical protein F4X80_05875 [Chloroflexi bacterium]|nr:hypothetical protein [Chloroflexota bacterium]